MNEGQPTPSANRTSLGNVENEKQSQIMDGKQDGLVKLEDAQAQAGTGLTLEAARASLSGQTGKKYWRSLDELENTPGFHEMLQREFPPAGARSGSTRYAGADS